MIDRWQQRPCEFALFRPGDFVAHLFQKYFMATQIPPDRHYFAGELLIFVALLLQICNGGPGRLV